MERPALLVAALTSFLGPFMISSVNIALPTIQADLQLTAVQLSWVATAYLLAVAVVALPAGRIADIYGRKRVFAVGLTIYTVASTATACVYSAAWLLTCRVAQGVGSGLFITTGMAIVTSIFPPHKRGRAIGIYVAAVYVGLSVGPFVGGAMAQQFGWRSIFWLMLPLGAGSLAVTFAYLRGEWAGTAGQRLDIAGSLIYAIAILALVYGASKLPAELRSFAHSAMPTISVGTGETLSWPDAVLSVIRQGSLIAFSFHGTILTVIGLAGLVVFFRQQQRAAQPLFEVSLFTANRTFTFSSLAALLNYAATFAVTFLMSLYLQYLKGMSPRDAGTLLMIQPVVMAIFSPMVGRLSDRVEPRLLASAGMAVTVVGMLVFSQLHPGGNDLVGIGVNLLLLGFGFALFSSPNTSAIMGSVAREHYGIASGTVATMRLLGQMLSMTTATIVLTLLVGHKAISPANFDRFLLSVRVVFLISALFCTIGIFCSLARGRLRPS